LRSDEKIDFGRTLQADILEYDPREDMKSIPSSFLYLVSWRNRGKKRCKWSYRGRVLDGGSIQSAHLLPVQKKKKTTWPFRIDHVKPQSNLPLVFLNFNLLPDRFLWKKLYELRVYESSKIEVPNINDKVRSNLGLFLRNTCSNNLDFCMNVKSSMN